MTKLEFYTKEYKDFIGMKPYENFNASLKDYCFHTDKVLEFKAPKEFFLKLEQGTDIDKNILERQFTQVWEDRVKTKVPYQVYKVFYDEFKNYLNNLNRFNASLEFYIILQDFNNSKYAIYKSNLVYPYFTKELWVESYFFDLSAENGWDQIKITQDFKELFNNWTKEFLFKKLEELVEKYGKFVSKNPQLTLNESLTRFGNESKFFNAATVSPNYFSRKLNELYKFPEDVVNKKFTRCYKKINKELNSKTFDTLKVNSENPLKEDDKGKKDSNGKLMVYELDAAFIKDMAKVMSINKKEFNGGKYERGNHYKTLDPILLLESLERHLLELKQAWQTKKIKDVIDDDSCSHLTKIAVNSMLIFIQLKKDESNS